MSEKDIELKGIDEIPIFSWNTKTKEFYVLEHKFDGVNSIEDFINYIHNLDKENKQLKADLEMYENGVYFSSENDKLQNEIDNLNHIIDKQDKDITILSKGNKHLKEILEKMGLEPNDILYLQQENQQLKIQASAREEVANKYKEVIDKAILIIKGVAYGGNEDYYIEKLKSILDILKEVSKWN